MFYVFVGVLCAILTPRVRACLWDRDTLRFETQGMPGLVEIITGRFERNPPLYYEMRLTRVAAEIEKDPTRLDLYDDAAVACDRLHNDDEAIGWMAKKRTILDKVDAEQVKDHWYRYYANLGTFHAHRWLRAGANRGSLADLRLGRDLIAKAIEINPDAHFGREKFQLMAIDWLIEMPPAEVADASATFLAMDKTSQVSGRLNRVPDGYQDAIQGLSGLIMLGDAWESVDVHLALARVLAASDRATVVELAQLRIHELVSAGRQSLHPDVRAALGKEQSIAVLRIAGSHAEIPEAHAKEIRDFFIKARKAADAVRDARTTYMLTKLKQGQHPDTHADFWDGYVEPEPLTPPGYSFRTGALAPDNPLLWVLVGIPTGMFAVGVGLVWRGVRRSRARRCVIPSDSEQSTSGAS